MQKVRLEWKHNDTFFLIGPLNFYTVPNVWEQSRLLLLDPRRFNLVIDLQHVTSSDSSGVALLLAWMKLKHRHQGSIRFKNPPAIMQAIITFSGLVDVLNGFQKLDRQASGGEHEA